MTNKRGVFLTLEGGEGVGKSTNHAFIAAWLRAQNIPFIETREPGGTPLAEDIRAMLLQPRSEKVAEKTELLLMFAARAQHLNAVIEPALAAGTWVLCDRFTDASYAYQGFGRGLDLHVIEVLETLVQAELKPDVTVLLDADPRVGMARAAQRSAADRIEQEQLSFFDRVREGYLARVAADPQRFIVIDAERELEQVQSALEQALEQRFSGVLIEH